jgi:hypothetical protein
MNTILDKRKIPDRRNLVQSVQHDLRAHPVPLSGCAFFNMSAYPAGRMQRSSSCRGVFTHLSTG